MLPRHALNRRRTAGTAAFTALVLSAEFNDLACRSATASELRKWWGRRRLRG